MKEIMTEVGLGGRDCKKFAGWADKLGQMYPYNPYSFCGTAEDGGRVHPEDRAFVKKALEAFAYFREEPAYSWRELAEKVSPENLLWIEENFRELPEDRPIFSINYGRLSIRFRVESGGWAGQVNLVCGPCSSVGSSYLGSVDYDGAPAVIVDAVKKDWLSINKGWEAYYLGKENSQCVVGGHYD